ncbi:MAG TPA: hypothetical protein GYA10_00470 [Alphaproteobacteria bacterium]|nr:hypothetical protein [Alphaproteobacteria bacterium]
MVRSPATKPKAYAGAGTNVRYRPIDLRHLARQTLGDKGLEQEVLRLFDDTVRIYFGRVEHSTTVEDLIRNLHTLKGAAAGVGANAVAALAGSAEAALREGRPVDPEQIADLEVAVTECRAFIAELIEDGDE